MFRIDESVNLQAQSRSRDWQYQPDLLDRQSACCLKQVPICSKLSGIGCDKAAPLISPLRRRLVIHQDPASDSAQHQICATLNLLPFCSGVCNGKLDGGDGVWPSISEPCAQGAQLVMERCSVHAICGLHPLQDRCHIGQVERPQRRHQIGSNAGVDGLAKARAVIRRASVYASSDRYGLDDARGSASQR